MVSTSNSRTRSPTPDKITEYGLPEDYKPYIPVAKRRKQLLSKLEAKKVADELPKEREQRERDEVDTEEREREKIRRERTLLQQAQEVKERRAIEGEHQFSVALRVEAMLSLSEYWGRRSVNGRSAMADIRCFEISGRSCSGGGSRAACRNGTRSEEAGQRARPGKRHIVDRQLEDIVSGRRRYRSSTDGGRQDLSERWRRSST